MKNYRNWFELRFKGLGRRIYNNPKKTLLVMFIIFAAFASRLPDITVDTSTEGFLHEDDPVLLDYYNFRDQFGRDEMIALAIKSNNIFTFSFLEKLKRLHNDLEENVPYVAEVTSLINARNTRGEKDELIVEDLLEDWPKSGQDLEAIKKRAMSNSLYENIIISEDGSFTTIIIETNNYSHEDEELDVFAGFDSDFAPDMAESMKPTDRQYLTDRENSEAVNAVQNIVRKYQGSDFKVYVAGSPVVTDFLKRTMLKDMRKFLGLAILTIGVLLFLLFRRISGVLSPLLVVMLALLSTVGAMAAAGVPLKLPTQILPSFILAVGVGDAVHLLSIFFQKFRETGDKGSAMEYALGHAGLPIFLTSLTTAGGLLSFSTADIAPIADLGIFAAVGVMFALVYSITLLPALISIMPLKIPEQGRHSKPAFIDGIFDFAGKLSTRYPYRILFVSGIVLLVSMAGILKINFSHDIVGWFPEKSEVRIATETIDRELRGSVNLEIVIDTRRENGLYDPEFLKRLEKSTDYMESLKKGEIFVGKAWSIPVVIKEVNQALHANKKGFYSIPDNKDLIAQEFLLFENSGSDDLEDFTDSMFSKARVTVKVPFRDAVLYSKFLETVRTHFKQEYPDCKVSVTGMISIFFQTLSNVISSMAKSYCLAFLVITLLMILLLGRLSIGLLSMVPNLTPVIITLGLMGWAGLPVDLFTMLIGCIALGLAVDDTIHFMHGFKACYDKTGNAESAVFETLHSTGRAMLITTCVLSVGFFIFMFATLNNLFNFGLLTGITIIMALLSDYFIAPALLVSVYRVDKKI